MPFDQPEVTSSTPRTDLEQLRCIVWQDHELQARLWETHDRATFIQFVMRLAAEHGLALTVEELQAEIEASKRTWFQRWP